MAPRREHIRDGMNLKSQAVKGSTHEDIQWQRGKQIPEQEESDGQPGQTRVNSHGSNHDRGRVQRVRPGCNHVRHTKPSQWTAPSAWHIDQGHQTSKHPTYQIYRLAIPLSHTTILHKNDLPARIDVINPYVLLHRSFFFSLFFLSFFSFFFSPFLKTKGMPRQVLGRWPATYAQTYFSISGYFQSRDHN